MVSESMAIGVTNNGIFDLEQIDSEVFITVIELNDRYPDWQLDSLRAYSNLHITYLLRQRIVIPHEKGSSIGDKQAIMDMEKKYPSLFGTASVKLIKIEGRNIFVQNFKVLHGIEVIDIKPYMLDTHEWGF